MQPRFQLEIHDPLPARLVDAAPHRLGRNRDGDRRGSAALDEQIAQLAEHPAEAHGVAIVETGDVRDVVGCKQGTELDLHELRRRVLVFELGLRGEEPPVTLAERGDRLRGNFLLALQPDARAFGEAEDIFGLDLAEFRAVTPPEFQYFITDLFETITLWENRAVSAVYKEKGNGRYDVTLKVSAKKLRADEDGKQTEIPMDDLVDIGVLGADDAPLYLKKHRIKTGETTLTIEVTAKPLKAGIDPVIKLIDRRPDDNVVPVTTE